MKLPARLALVASTGILLVAGLTVGTGFASTVRDSGADSVQSLNRTTSMLSLEPSRQINLLGSLRSQGNHIQSNGNIGEDQFVRGRFGDQVVDRPHEGERHLRGRHKYGKFRQVTKAVAGALDMKVSDVVALEKEGKTLAQIISDNNGDFDAIVDTQVEPLREKLQEKVDSGDITQEQMDQHLGKAEEHINAVLNGERHLRGPHKSSRFQQVTKAVAGALDMEVSDVVALKKEGKTLAQIISDNNGDFDAIVHTQVEPLREKLQEKVDSGDITQGQMDQHLGKAEEHINAVLNGERPWGMHKGKNRSHGRDRGNEQKFRPNRGGDTQIDSETTAH